MGFKDAIEWGYITGLLKTHIIDNKIPIGLMLEDTREPPVITKTLNYTEKFICENASSCFDYSLPYT